MRARTRRYFELCTVQGGRTYVYSGLGDFASLDEALARYATLPGKAAGDFVRESVDVGWGIQTPARYSVADGVRL